MPKRSVRPTLISISLSHDSPETSIALDYLTRSLGVQFAEEKKITVNSVQSGYTGVGESSVLYLLLFRIPCSRDGNSRRGKAVYRGDAGSLHVEANGRETTRNVEQIAHVVGF
jgi:hypothetical protein